MTTSIAMISVGAFFIVWIVSCKVISLFGWSDLARRHRSLTPTTGTRHSWQSFSIGRLAKYSGCITVHTSKTGIHLTILPIFRVGHPSLFFPWSAVRFLKQKPSILGHYFLYDFGTPRIRRLAFPTNIHQAIQRHQNGIPEL